MGCSSCGTGGGCSPAGCKSNGGCSSGGCNRLNVFDWLSNMDIEASKRFDMVEVRFKGSRKEFFKNKSLLELHTGDAVIVDIGNGQDLGFVSLQGELVRLQMQKRAAEKLDETRPILKLADASDLEKFEQAKARELPALYRTRQIIQEQKLSMKLSDVEFQLDGKKATFYYSADDRVDFRELIKVLAAEFKIRVEMRQISLRQEAGRLGGIGVCGRELCCSTWLTDFKNVATSAARYQNLSLNPSKLSGQCGRLKCCLNYELDTYMDAWKGIPQMEAPLQTQKGTAVLQKTDIFRKIMWFSFKDDSEWHAVQVADVQKIIELNKKGIKPNTLNPNDLTDKENVQVPVKINKDLERLDHKYKHKNKHKNRPKKK